MELPLDEEESEGEVVYFQAEAEVEAELVEELGLLLPCHWQLQVSVNWVSTCPKFKGQIFARRADITCANS